MRLFAFVLCLGYVVVFYYCFTELYNGGTRDRAQCITMALEEAELVWQAFRQKQRQATKQLASGLRVDPWALQGQLVFWDLFAPIFHCPRSVERVGRLGDGGKWICGFTHIAKMKPSCTVYSFGIANDISFEKEVLDRSHCVVKMFDYTINTTYGPPSDLVDEYNGRAALYPIGLGSSNTGELRTLATIMKLQGDKFIDILKVDIEGAEFMALSTILQEFNYTLPFGQLQVEIHMNEFHEDKHAVLGKFVHWFGQLELAGLRSFFYEPNEIMNIVNKKGYTELIEYAFLNIKIDPAYFYS